MKVHRKRYYLRRGRQSRRDEIVVARMNRDHRPIYPYTVAWLHGWERSFGKSQRAVEVREVRMGTGRRALMELT